jgi:anti-sigma factor ChrR (cupin superfamily)
VAKARRGGRRSRAPSSGADRGTEREHWRADGQPKSRFPTQADANRSSLRLRLEEGIDLDPYECRYCGGWHLGSRRT